MKMPHPLRLRYPKSLAVKSIRCEIKVIVLLLSSIALKESHGSSELMRGQFVITDDSAFGFKVATL
jgi:hypothetical protein